MRVARFLRRSSKNALNSPMECGSGDGRAFSARNALRPSWEGTRQQATPREPDGFTAAALGAYAVGMGRIRPWHIHARRMCEALIEEPGRAWSPGRLATVSGCGERAVQRISHQLWLAGAVEYARTTPPVVEQDSSASTESPRQTRSLSLKAADEGRVIRDLLNSGHPQSVASTWLWEGPGNATAVWRVKRRERAWRRRSRSQSSHEIGDRAAGGRFGRAPEKFAEWWRRSPED